MNRNLLLVLALGVASTQAACPNQCSGHGACGNDDICTCYRDWVTGDEEGGDCSQRKCPYELAWVDTPESANTAHRLAECANRGVCDRETGECVCFEGYTGKGCRRTTCPNDCSGHGTCEYISEFHNDLGDDFKWTGSNPTTDQYDHSSTMLWDSKKTRGCVCDPKWTDVDCSRRMCPKGNYALYSNAEPTHETQVVYISNVYTFGGSSGYGEFALTFRSTLGEEFTTYTLDAFNITASDVEDALNSLPNKVIEEVDVTISTNQTADMKIEITFSGSMTTGDQYALECRTDYCGAGCQPMRMNAMSLNSNMTCTVFNDYRSANSVNTECSGRGKCDYESGVCECFEGYTDAFCSTQTALI